MEFSQDVCDNLPPQSAGSNSDGKHSSGVGGRKYGYNNWKEFSDSGISDYSDDASSRKTSTASSAGAIDSSLEDIEEEPINVQSKEALRKCKTMDWVRYKTVIKQILFNNLAVSFIVGYMGHIILLHLLNGTESEEIFETLPTLTSILWQLPMLLVIHALLQLLMMPFYYPHALKHHELHNGHVHNLHHEWTASVVMASTYAPPVKHIIKNLLPIAVGPMLLKCHVVTVWIWYNYAALDAFKTHSGCHLTWMISTKFFDSRCSKHSLVYDTQMRVLAWNFVDWLQIILKKKLWTISGDEHFLDTKSVLPHAESVRIVSKLNCKAKAA